MEDHVEIEPIVHSVPLLFVKYPRPSVENGHNLALSYQVKLYNIQTGQ